MGYYALTAASGVLALTGPAPVLLSQGGRGIAIAWGIFGLAGALLGLVGTLRRALILELTGQILGASASLTWSVALIMQAVATHNLGSLTAACLAAASATLIGQRWVDAAHAVRAGERR